MSQGYLTCVLHHLRTLADAPTAPDVSDGELLEHFLRRRDEAAFAALVQRHGPMVLGLCRRRLGELHAAEDAFQATFLVLARAAASVRQQSSVAGWLYGVARRVCGKIRARDAARRARERQAAAMPCADAEDRDWPELRALLEEEIDRLPEKYRAPLVLCYLEGKTQEQAAHELGCPRSSLASRLGRARALLQAALTRRGVTLSAGLVGGVLAQGTAAAVPAPLLLATVQAALAFATHGTAAAVALAPGAVAAAESVGRALGYTRLKVFGLIVLGLLLTGTGLKALTATPAAEPPPAAAAKQAPPVRRPAVARTDRYGDPLPAGALSRLGTLRLYHGWPVDGVTFSPDGKLVVSTARNNNRLWEVTTGKERPVPAHLQVAFVFTHKDRLLAAEWRSDSHRLWDLASGKEVLPSEVSVDVQRLSREFADARTVVSPDGAVRAVAALDRAPERIRLEDARSRQVLPPLLNQPDEQAGSLSFSPDGKYLAATYSKPTVRLWDLTTRKQVRQFRPKDYAVSRTAFSPDGKVLAGADGSSVTLWDVATGKWLHDCGHNYYVGSLAFTPDGSELLTGSGYNDPTVRRWDPLTGRETGQLRGHTVGIQALAISPDGRLTASGSQDRTLRLWDTATGKELRRLGDGKRSVWSAAFSADGKLLASGDMQVRLWDVATGQPVRAFGKGPILQLAFSPDGKALASTASDDTVVRLWDVATGQELRQFAGTTRNPPYAFSPDGRQLVVGDGERGTLQLWDTATGRPLYSFGNPLDKDARSAFVLGAVVFSPDGRTVAAGFANESVGLWEVASGQARVFFTEGHRAAVVSLAFSPDGGLLVSGSWDRTAMVWDVRERWDTVPYRGGRPDLSLDQLWADLAHRNAGNAYRALKWMSAKPEAAKFLGERLRPAALDAKRAAALIADLDSGEFAVREKASAGLFDLGEGPAPALRAALAGKPSPEMRRRAEAVLARLFPIRSPERLRELRAVEVLENLGTPEARQVLTRLAEGAADARMTQEARASVERLGRRRLPGGG